MIDYHVHTALCNHASGTMEAYVQRAIDIGLSEICFLDHLTLQPAEPQLSMTPDEVPFYFQALQLLRQKYRDRIAVKIGLEIDFNPEHVGLFEKIIARFPFDVIGGSLHFPGGFDIVSRRSDWKNGHQDPDAVYALYVEQLKKMLAFEYFDVVCHLDLVKKFGWKSTRDPIQALGDVLAMIKDKNLTLEINTSGYRHPIQELYPAPNILKQCCDQGIRVTLGSDAHDPDAVGQYYDRALPLLLAAGYRHLTTFSRRRPIPLALTTH